MSELFTFGRSPEKLYFLAEQAERLSSHCDCVEGRASLILISQAFRSEAERVAFRRRIVSLHG